MRPSRPVHAAVFLALALLPAAPAVAGERYAFSGERKGGLVDQESKGRVVTDGTNYRIEYEPGTEAQQVRRVLVSADGGAHESWFYPERRTYHDVEVDRAGRASRPSLGLLVLLNARLRADQRSADEVQLAITAAAELEETPEGRVRRHELRLSYRVTIQFPNEQVRGRVQVQATYWVAEGRKLFVPLQLNAELHTSFPEIDRRLAEALALPGAVLRQELTARADLEGGAEQLETIKVVLQKIETVPTRPDLFKVPAGFRYEDPISAPELIRPGS